MIKCEEWAEKREVESWAVGGLMVEKLRGLPQNEYWCTGGGIMGGKALPDAKLFFLILCKYLPKIRLQFYKIPMGMIDSGASRKRLSII
jgi:hypothetical protein